MTYAHLSPPTGVDLAEKLATFNELWQPRVVGQFNARPAIRRSARCRALPGGGGRSGGSADREAGDAEHRKRSDGGSAASNLRQPEAPQNIKVTDSLSLTDTAPLAMIWLSMVAASGALASTPIIEAM